MFYVPEGNLEIEGYKVKRRSEISGATVNLELALVKRMFNLSPLRT
jgi:hypothetical protein